MWQEQKFSVTEEPFLLVGLTVLEAQPFHPVPVEMRRKQRRSITLRGNVMYMVSKSENLKDIFLLMETQIKWSSLVKT